MVKQDFYSDIAGGLVVAARWKVAPGNGDRIVAILREFLPQAQAEPGVKVFQIARDKADPDQYLFWEVFADEAAFQAHSDSAHFKDLILGKALPLLADRQRAQYALI